MGSSNNEYKTKRDNVEDLGLLDNIYIWVHPAWVMFDLDFLYSEKIIDDSKIFINEPETFIDDLLDFYQRTFDKILDEDKKQGQNSVYLYVSITNDEYVKLLPYKKMVFSKLNEFWESIDETFKYKMETLATDINDWEVFENQLNVDGSYIDLSKTNRIVFGEKKDYCCTDVAITFTRGFFCLYNYPENPRRIFYRPAHWINNLTDRKELVKLHKEKTQILTDACGDNYVKAKYAKTSENKEKIIVKN